MSIFYAVVYVANATLSTKGPAGSKHSRAMAVFRESFVKCGLVESVYSHAYGRLMDDRHLDDYEIRATISADDGRRFVDRMKVYPEDNGWL